MSLEGFSAAQLAHIGAISLDHYIRGPLWQIGIQAKPLLEKLEAKARPFDAAKEKISIGVKFQRGAGGVNDGVKGYSASTPVTFYNPANGLRAEYVWREHHIGYTLDETQLKTQGLLVGDEFEKKIRGRGDRGLTILAKILDEANEDFMERYKETMNALMWGDGTADTSALHGMRAFITDVPTIGVKGGLSCATHSRWRNRARTAAFAAHGSFSAAHGGNRITSAVADGGALLTALDTEMVQLRRYGGAPNTALAGSDFIDAMKKEMRANGQYYTITSEMKAGMDASIPKVSFSGIEYKYDPTLDDLGRSKFAYIWDDRHIYLSPLEGDWKRLRDPARPFNQFVMHKSLICTGQVIAKQLDSALVIEIA
ncbi:MAG: phage major capsid protein [Thauera sp.]|nr:phage major capsid protein [Thauera sp.]